MDCQLPVCPPKPGLEGSVDPERTTHWSGWARVYARSTPRPVGPRPGVLSLFSEKSTGGDQPSGCRSTSESVNPHPFLFFSSLSLKKGIPGVLEPITDISWRWLF